MVNRWTGPVRSSRVDGRTQARLILASEELRALFAVSAAARISADPRCRALVLRRAHARAAAQEAR